MLPGSSSDLHTLVHTHRQVRALCLSLSLSLCLSYDDERINVKLKVGKYPAVKARK